MGVGVMGEGGTEVGVGGFLELAFIFIVIFAFMAMG